MADEIEKEIITKKVSSDSNIPANGYKVSEQRTTKVANDNSSNVVFISVLLFLAVGAGFIAYFVNNRPAPTPVLMPSAVDTVRENKSTVIERNNTTIREVPATVQPTPKVEITVAPQAVPVPAPTVTATVTAQPQAVTPAATPKPQMASPTPTSGSNN
ncbi:hypothetical protein [Pseudanabaena sp. 'Roaring Creek']|uniref:hypothetical protein n=1 Tax=Pseudanabaena sp. 'Roaring Creek' TaxID=1681830 RepID=UPI0006D7F2E0|nr:hypothetical protein [Pseudanabaena sp. 'Roaring Creek']